MSDKIILKAVLRTRKTQVSLAKLKMLIFKMTDSKRRGQYPQPFEKHYLALGVTCFPMWVLQQKKAVLLNQQQEISNVSVYERKTLYVFYTIY